MSILCLLLCIRVLFCAQAKLPVLLSRENLGRKFSFESQDSKSPSKYSFESQESKSPTKTNSEPDNIEQYKDPTPTNAKEFFDLGNAQADLGDLTSAHRNFEKSISLDPKQPETHFNLGVVNFRLQAFNAACQSFTRALALDPNDADAYWYLGDAESELGDDRGAKESHAEAFYYFGLNSLMIKDFENAFEMFEKAIELVPSHQKAHYQLGLVSMRFGDLKGAQISLNKAAALDMLDSSAHFGLGEAHSKSGNDHQAYESYKKSVELDPDDFKVHCNLGVVKHRLLDLEGARESYVDAIALNPKAVFPQINLAIVNIALGLEKEDTTFFAEAFVNVGVMRLRNEDFEKAYQDFKMATEVAPKYAIAHYYCGVALKEIGDLEGAKKSIAIAVRLEPIYMGAIFEIEKDTE